MDKCFKMKEKEEILLVWPLLYQPEFLFYDHWKITLFALAVCLYFENLNTIYLFVYVHALLPVTVCMCKSKDNLQESVSIPAPPYGSQGSNPGHQALVVSTFLPWSILLAQVSLLTCTLYTVHIQETDKMLLRPLHFQCLSSEGMDILSLHVLLLSLLLCRVRPHGCWAC